MKRIEQSERLRWPARPKRDDTLVARRRVWTTRCKRYRVVHSHIVYGEGSIPDCWDMLGRHRTKNAAMKDCERHAADNKLPLAV